MSKLIVMPTAEEIERLGKKIAPKPNLLLSPGRKKAKAVEAVPDLIGHTLGLNVDFAKKFQCGGFNIGPMRPFATVTSETQQGPLHKALAEGKLIDITGSATAKGLKNRYGSTSEVKEEDTGKKCFVATDAHGNMYVVTPKNKTEQKKFEREIKKTGTIKTNYQRAEDDQVSGFSKVTEEDLPVLVDTSGQPIKNFPKKKVQSSVSPQRSKRRTK